MLDAKTNSHPRGWLFVLCFVVCGSKNQRSYFFSEKKVFLKGEKPSKLLLLQTEENECSDRQKKQCAGLFFPFGFPHKRREGLTATTLSIR